MSVSVAVDGRADSTTERHHEPVGQRYARLASEQRAGIAHEETPVPTIPNEKAGQRARVAERNGAAADGAALPL